jgi:CheY-like chemotaxis protein
MAKLSLNMQNNTITILLVDDDTQYVSIVKHLLRPFQNKIFKLISEDSGKKVIETLKTNPEIDLVLMDYYLQTMNGLEIARRFFEEKIDVPIIFLTSNKDLHIAVEAIKYGVEDYLVKDETSDTILPRTIINVLDRVQLKKLICTVEQEKFMSQKKTEAVRELVVTMCHEFNNPLAAIKISADILLRQKVSDDDKQLLTNLNKNIGLLEKQIIKLRDINIGS